MREAILGEQQPEPTSTDEPSAHDLVIADMAARKEFGLAKYGSLLQASNGRDNLQDLYEELLDACVYIRNEIERRKLADEHTMRTIGGHRPYTGPTDSAAPYFESEPGGEIRKSP